LAEREADNAEMMGDSASGKKLNREGAKGAKMDIVGI